MAETLKDKKSFVIYKDWQNLLCSLELKQKGKLLDGIFKFQCDGETDNFDGDTALQGILNFFISAFEQDNRKYIERRNANREKANKRWANNTKQCNGIKEHTENAVNDNDNVNVNDTVNDNDLLPPSDKPKTEKQTKHKYGKFKNVLLSDKDMEALKEKYPCDYTEKIENLSEGIELKGYKYKNHYLAILKWAQNDNKTQRARPDLCDFKRYEGNIKL